MADAVRAIAQKIVDIGGTQSKLGKVYLRELAEALAAPPSGLTNEQILAMDPRAQALLLGATFRQSDCTRCHGTGEIITPEGTAWCTCGRPNDSESPKGSR